MENCKSRWKRYEGSPHPPLASTTVNYVGDHVAVVIAESLDEAKHAASLVKVDYKILKAVVGTGDAMKSEAIHEGIEKICFDFGLGDKLKLMRLYLKLTR